ncbi:MAG: class I SAM-dependent methyltransferase [Desulfobulbia bacterium]
MEQEERKAKIRETFNTVAEGYDTPALRFFADNPRHLAEYLALRGDEHLLDVATGTGNAALALAAMLPGGRVTGVDFAADMLDRARLRAKAAQLDNVEFVEMDMQFLAYPDGHFSAACCAFGIFFVEDMEGQLAHIAAKVKPGGRVAISGFTEKAFSPQVEIFYARLRRYGVEPPPLSWKRIATEASCEALFRSGGLVDIRVGRRNLGYFLKGPEEWWEVIWQAGFRGLVNQLAPNDLTRFRTEHLAEIGALQTPEGIRFEVEALYTAGTKPYDKVSPQ